MALLPILVVFWQFSCCWILTTKYMPVRMPFTENGRERKAKETAECESISSIVLVPQAHAKAIRTVKDE